MIKHPSNLSKISNYREPEAEPQKNFFSESRIDLTSNISALEREYRQDLILVLQKLEVPKTNLDFPRIAASSPFKHG